MSFFPSKKKLSAERDRLQAEIKIIASRNSEKVMAGEKLSVDEMIKPLLPLSGRVVEIENRIIELSSKRELIAERNALQFQLNLLLPESKSLFDLSEEERLSVRDINRKIAKLDYVIESKYSFVNSIGRWFENIRTFFILAAGAVAIASITYKLFL